MQRSKSSRLGNKEADKPVEFFLLELQVGDGNQLIQFALGLDDLSLSGRISPALLFALVDPGTSSKSIIKNRYKSSIDFMQMSQCKEKTNICRSNSERHFSMKQSMNERLMPTYLTEQQMMRMRNMAKKKDSRTPRMICSSLVSRLSTGDTERQEELLNTAHTSCQILHDTQCNYLPF